MITSLRDDYAHGYTLEKEETTLHLFVAHLHRGCIRARFKDCQGSSLGPLERLVPRRIGEYRLDRCRNYQMRRLQNE